MCHKRTETEPGGFLSLHLLFHSLLTSALGPIKDRVERETPHFYPDSVSKIFWEPYTYLCLASIGRFSEDYERNQRWQPRLLVERLYLLASTCTCFYRFSSFLFLA